MCCAHINLFEGKYTRGSIDVRKLFILWNLYEDVKSFNLN